MCPPLKETEVSLHGATGGGLNVAGSADIDFQLQGKPYHFCFCVAELRGVDVLLGLDFLMAMGAKVDLAAMQVTIGEQEVRIGDSGVSPVHAVRVKALEMLPAGTARVVPARVDH